MNQDLYDLTLTTNNMFDSAVITASYMVDDAASLWIKTLLTSNNLFFYPKSYDGTYIERVYTGADGNNYTITHFFMLQEDKYYLTDLDGGRII